MNKAFLLLLVCSIGNLKAHQMDRLFVLHSLNTAADSLVKTERKHSPHRASLYSAVLPGLGQAYNRKYWKIPIVLAALGTAGYFIIENRREMRERQDALILLMDNDSSTNPVPEFANYSTSILKAQRNSYRTNRDYAIIAFAGFYLLNIVDAAVDAHFYKFNIDKPLAERREKRWNIYSESTGFRQTIGFRWRF